MTSPVGYTEPPDAKIMEEVERKARSWEALHRNTHQNRSHPKCPWCLNRT